MIRRPHGVRFLAGALVLVGALALVAFSGGASSGGNFIGAASSLGARSQGHPSAQQILNRSRSANLKNAQLTAQTAVCDTQGNPLISLSSNGQINLNPYQAKLNTTTTGPGLNLQTREVLINNKLYVQQVGASSWRQVSVSNLQAFLGQNNGLSSMLSSPSQLFSLANPKYVGSPTVNGQKTYEIRGQVSRSAQGSASGSGSSGSNNSGSSGSASGASGSSAQSGGNGSVSFVENLWVTQNNYHPVKVVLKATGSGSASTSGTGTSSTSNSGTSSSASNSSASSCTSSSGNGSGTSNTGNSGMSGSGSSGTSSSGNGSSNSGSGGAGASAGGSSNGSSTSSSNQVVFQTTMTFSKWNSKGVSISAPSNTSSASGMGSSSGSSGSSSSGGSSSSSTGSNG